MALCVYVFITLSSLLLFFINFRRLGVLSRAAATPLISQFCVFCFAFLRSIDTIYHVGGWYVDWCPDLLKHLLFELPLCFLFSSYILTVGNWHSILVQFAGRARTSPVIAIVSVFNVVVWSTMIVLTCFVRLSEDDRLRWIGINNLVLSLEFVFALVYFVILGAAFLVVLRRQESMFSLARPTSYRPLSIKIAVLTLCSSLCFLAFIILFSYEGVYMINHGFFFLLFEGYTTTTTLLYIHLWITSTPPIVLLACLLRLKSGGHARNAPPPVPLISCDAHA